MTDNGTKARGVFYQNYDYVETPGEEIGPGAGLFSNMDKYKSVKDFIDKKNKRKNRMKARKAALMSLAFDFALKDETIINDAPSTVNTPGEGSGPYANYGDLYISHESNPAGGETDTLHTLPDQDGKGWWDLDIGRLENEQLPLELNKKLDKWTDEIFTSPSSSSLNGVTSPDLIEDEVVNGPQMNVNKSYAPGDNGENAFSKPII